MRKDPRVDDPTMPPPAAAVDRAAPVLEHDASSHPTPVPTSLAQRVAAAYAKAKLALEQSNGAHAAVSRLARRLDELERTFGQRIREAMRRATDSQVDAEEAKEAATLAASTSTAAASVVTATIVEERRPLAGWQSKVLVALLTLLVALVADLIHDCTGAAHGAPHRIEMPEAE